MKQQPMKSNANVLKYWASKEYEYPIIARIARDHLVIPAILAASESVFSTGGDIITKKRNKLGVDNTRRLLCLRDWGVFATEGSEIAMPSWPMIEYRAETWYLLVTHSLSHVL
jgi:hypothetical protein